MELKNVDIIAQELVQKKNENELKEYLFDQLQLLDYKKRNDQNLLNIKNSIKQLEKDKLDLRKCNIIVSRVLNKKIVENNQFDLKIKKLQDEIDKVKGSIKYYELLGDYYLTEINNLKGVNNI